MPGVDFAISDADKTGLMSCSHGVDRSKGLDLVLHTPGGDVAATESIIDYLHSLYDGNIRAIVPQLAMSGGTLMAVSCRDIVMGRQSSLGPVDPQIGHWAAQGVIEEFKRAVDETTKNPASIPMWNQVIQKYWPTLITNCEHAINWSDDLLRTYLANCMFADLSEAERNPKIEAISDLLGKQATSKNHARHINPTKAKAAGLRIVDLEGDQKLQDYVLTLHHALTITMSETRSVKIIENDQGSSYVTAAVEV
ncbi:S49 family peptidase [Dyella marensis]|uniref:SDH family Clp fold serine proteinase n=1 Tax=Dyella marensis TaxID=500610 RepID=UPI0031DA4403